MVRCLPAFLGLFLTAAPSGCSDSDDSTGLDVSGDTSRCVGTPEPCESFHDFDSCIAQGGCHWVFHYYECNSDAPGPTPCELHSREDSCERQVGCTWVE
ncbi:MAG: hypothetical protein JXB32_01720 [Deltaproteobacteria bacterium]|nr:hypothetical protein [Deltaproteobacteria bacterium]